MTIPGFRTEALAEGASPKWIDELATADPNHLLHVVRGLAPADAVELVGGTVLRHLKPYELPAGRPDDWSTTAHAAIGADRMKDLLVAGQRGDWTFVYDAAGVTGWTPERAEMATVLSANGRAAGTSILTINADSSFCYAEDGEIVIHIDADDPKPTDDEVPDVLRAAIEAAGRADSEDEDEDEDEDFLDVDANMRIACALAGLTWTTGEFRAQPLLVGEVTSSYYYEVMAEMRSK
ncbi:MAG TPA: DUF6461 domain-containing protein [Trebonia sp.]|jgi:hypothetical protein|nr:DUF6461 domain-containing protein [Trebonia sp.]